MYLFSWFAQLKMDDAVLQFDLSQNSPPFGITCRFWL